MSGTARVGIKWKSGIRGRTKKRLWRPMQDIPRVYIGIGNPGDSYKDIRHNVGKDWIDFFARKMNLEWSTNDKLECELTYFRDGKMLLVKPQRYMNMYGPTVAKLMNEMEISIADCVFIHDCLFTKFGTWRHQRGMGSWYVHQTLHSGCNKKWKFRLVEKMNSGHPAIQSIQEYCGHSFWRFRIGIGSPPRHELLPKYITNPWTLREKQLLYSDVYDSILYHLLNSALAETDHLPIDAEALRKDPMLQYYKPYLLPVEGYWPGSKEDTQVDHRFEGSK